MKILNLNEGSFPIEMNLNLNSIDVPHIGILKDTLVVELKISKLSLNLLKCDGYISAQFIDTCQNCLKNTEVLIEGYVDVTIKDIKELHADSSGQDQTHYQDLEYFNIDNLIEEELTLIYPDIVKCDRKCLEKDDTLIQEKNLPFKKIRDLID
ncbi:hypothetical protein M9C81_03825 [SAR86 cluster bacterium]|nr:hypothetical protein M9C81_03825 [SAR86 cluster bacterium]